MLEVSHLAYTVANLERAMGSFHRVLGGEFTEIGPFDALLHLPLVQAEPKRVRGRNVWLKGQQPPLELFEWDKGSPWHVEPTADDAPLLHHYGYWVDDLDATAAKFQSVGFALECSAVHDGEGILGFCYLRNPSGSRIELQTTADKSAVDDWLHKGVPRKRPEWVKDLKR